MDRIDCELFAAYVEKYDKRNGLRKIYKDFGITKEKDRAKCREAWEFIKCQKDLIVVSSEGAVSEPLSTEIKSIDISVTSEAKATQDTAN